jgi:hypothetical protein
VVGCASKISEVYLLPVLEAVLAQFPFMVLGFQVDNGSEYVNHRVAKMLDKLHAEFTKSRASRSQDNALVEGNKRVPVFVQRAACRTTRGARRQAAGWIDAEDVGRTLNMPAVVLIRKQATQADYPILLG